jgi:hypothetical protein
LAPGSTRLKFFAIAVDRDGGAAGTSAGCDDDAASIHTASGEVRKQLPALLNVADLARHRDRCAKCRRGSCLVAALLAAADEGRARGDRRFPWRWQVISQKREVAFRLPTAASRVT